MVKRGRKPKLSVARAKQALELSGGIRTLAANKLNVHRSTLFNFMRKHSSLEIFASEIEEQIKDIAEAETIKAIRAGDMQTVRWYLETKGKDRGYSRRVESTGPDGGPIPVKQEKPDLSQFTDEELEILLCAAERRVASGSRSSGGHHYAGQANCDCGICKQAHAERRRTSRIQKTRMAGTARGRKEACNGQGK